jgi:hypothetical protein
MNLENQQKTTQDFDKVYNDPVGEKEMADAIGKIQQMNNNPYEDAISSTHDDQEKDDSKEEESKEESKEEILEPTSEADEVEDEKNEEEENEEDAEEEVKSKKSRKENKPYWLKKDLYKVKTEKLAAEQKIRELEHLLQESVNASTYHYGKNAYNELDSAKIRQKLAMESGDAEEFLQAQESFYKALNAVNELEKFAKSEKVIPHVEQKVPNYPNQELALEWLADHPELNPNSKRYKPTWHEKLEPFVSNLDRHLISTNQAHKIFSPDYFDAIDDHLEEIQQNSKKKEIKAIKSEAYISNVGGVRTNNVSGRTMQQAKKYEIHPIQKHIAKLLNLSDEEIIKSKMLKEKLKLTNR